MTRSRPIELYTVTYDFNRWYYTSADRDFEALPLVYRAVPIARSNIELSTDETGAEFTAEFPVDAEFFELFRVSPPTGSVTVLCERVYRDDPAREIIFKGRIVNIGWGLESNNVKCESSSQAIRRMGLRQHYQYGCPYMLYGPDCRADREAHRIDAVVTSIQGTVVTLSGLAGLYVDDYFAGGYIEYTHSQLGTIERMSVAKSVGATGVLTLFGLAPGLAPNSEIKTFKGCNRTLDHCVNRFANQENYGGQPFIPNKNPFGSGPMF